MDALMFANTLTEALTQYLQYTSVNKKVKDKAYQCCCTDHKLHLGFIVQKQSQKRKRKPRIPLDILQSDFTSKMWQLQIHYKQKSFRNYRKQSGTDRNSKFCPCFKAT